jgi:hypothetical protein
MKAIKKTALIIGMMFFLTALGVTAASAQPGSYSNISAKDIQVVKAAKFAVSAEQENTGGMFTGLKVIKARQQVVRGFNYKMCLSVKANGRTKTVEAIVNKFMGKSELLAWTWKGCR